MIEAGDRIELAPGVVVRGDVLVDDVRRVELPLNDSARLFLTGGETIAEASCTLARLGASEPLRDALAFASQLNALCLLNVRTSAWQRALRRVRALRYGIVLRAPPRRSTANETLPFLLALAPTAAVVAAALLPLALLAGAWAVAAAVTCGLGVLAHETAHMLALRGLPRALVLEGLKPSILHPRVEPARALLVASAGPLAPALAALVLALACRPVAAICAPLAAHALGLTVLAPDGRNACGLC